MFFSTLYKVDICRYTPACETQAFCWYPSYCRIDRKKKGWGEFFDSSNEDRAQKWYESRWKNISPTSSFLKYWNRFVEDCFIELPFRVWRHLASRLNLLKYNQIHLMTTNWRSTSSVCIANNNTLLVRKVSAEGPKKSSFLCHIEQSRIDGRNSATSTIGWM